MSEKYLHLFELGAGAFGKAHVVKCKKSAQEYVSKVIQIKGLSSSALDRCVTEVAVLSACSHPNIVRYVEAFVSEGSLHIVMEYASGGDLQQKIEEQMGTLFDSDTVLDWFLQVVMALEYIHSRNILHRDLKPQNIFLTDNGIVKLGDFGIARVLSSSNDLASTCIGTPFYISPEICRGQQYNCSSDMWAAGCLLYQMCSLHVPFHASHFEELINTIVKAQYAPIPSHFNPVISHIISELITEDPEKRPSAVKLLSMQELSERVVFLKKRNILSTGNRFSKRSKSLISKMSGPGKENMSVSCHEISNIATEMVSDQRKVTTRKSTSERNRSSSLNSAGVLCNNNTFEHIAEKTTSSNQDSQVQRSSSGKLQDKQPKEGGRRNSSTYTIKDSVARRLAEASPTLSQTISKQRFSPSVNTPIMALQKVKRAGKMSDGCEDDVFSIDGLEKIANKVESLISFVCKAEWKSWVVYPRTGDIFISDQNNPNESSNSVRRPSVSEVLYDVLCDFRTNRPQSLAVLYGNIANRLGSKQADKFTELVEKLSLERQEYLILEQVLSNEEKQLLPLVIMYNALR